MVIHDDDLHKGVKVTTTNRIADVENKKCSHESDWNIRNVNFRHYLAVYHQVCRFTMFRSSNNNNIRIQNIVFFHNIFNITCPLKT